jgi:hypothetical protein
LPVVAARRYSRLKWIAWPGQCCSHSRQNRQRPRSIANVGALPVTAPVGQTSAQAVQPAAHVEGLITGRPANREGSSGGGPSGYDIVR